MAGEGDAEWPDPLHFSRGQITGIAVWRLGALPLTLQLEKAC